MKVREKNPVLKKTIEELYRKGIKYPVWKSVAKALNKPRRKRYEVNLYKIEKFTHEKETVVVPGVVLGSGEINKPVIIAALRFTQEARKKIENVGGKCMSILEMAEKNPKGSGIKIIG